VKKKIPQLVSLLFSMLVSMCASAESVAGYMLELTVARKAFEASSQRPAVAKTPNEQTHIAFDVGRIKAISAELLRESRSNQEIGDIFLTHGIFLLSYLTPGSEPLLVRPREYLAALEVSFVLHEISGRRGELWRFNGADQQDDEEGRALEIVKLCDYPRASNSILNMLEWEIAAKRFGPDTIQEAKALLERFAVRKKWYAGEINQRQCRAGKATVIAP
jgi:hypothetical protein